MAGVDLGAARIGERWRIGTVELRVTAPRIPCAKLGAVMGDPGFLRRFARAGRPGAYFAIAREGELAAGDAVEFVRAPGHAVTVALVAEAVLLDASRLPELEAARADFTPKMTAFLAARGLPAR
jgi:MOSC domain-containing protein YiiM